MISGYDKLSDNWVNNKLPYYRVAFGHRIICQDNSTIYVTTPLLCGKGLSTMSSPENVKFNGNICRFDSQVNNAQYTHQISTHSNFLFGYDLTEFYNNSGWISEANNNTIWAIANNLSISSQNISSDKDFGLCIDNCNNSCYTILGSKLYNINNGNSLSYQYLDQEIAQYIPSGNTIISKQEKIKGMSIAGGYHFVFREFDVTYGFGTRVIFKKISLLKQTRKYDTPSLFIQNTGSLSDMPLTLQTLAINSFDTTLFTKGAAYNENVAPLFIRQLPDNQGEGFLPLFIKSLDPVEYSEVIGLNIIGLTSGNAFASSNIASLVLFNDLLFGNNLPINIFAPSTGLVNSLGLPLNINTGLAPGELSGSVGAGLSINIVNTQTVETNWMTNASSASLVMNATYGYSDGLPLNIFRKGPSGGEEVESLLGLNIINKNITSDVALYTTAIYGLGNNVSLVFLPSAGKNNQNIKIQIFGYEE